MINWVHLPSLCVLLESNPGLQFASADYYRKLSHRDQTGQNWRGMDKNPSFRFGSHPSYRQLRKACMLPPSPQSYGGRRGPERQWQTQGHPSELQGHGAAWAWFYLVLVQHTHPTIIPALLKVHVQPQTSVGVRNRSDLKPTLFFLNTTTKVMEAKHLFYVSLSKCKRIHCYANLHGNSLCWKTHHLAYSRLFLEPSKNKVK